MGKTNPEYAATVGNELWRGDDGQDYVKVRRWREAERDREFQFVYSADYNHDFVDFTSSVRCCPSDGSKCLLSQYLSCADSLTAKSDKDCDLIHL